MGFQQRGPKAREVGTQGMGGWTALSEGRKPSHRIHRHLTALPFPSDWPPPAMAVTDKKTGQSHAPHFTQPVTEAHRWVKPSTLRGVWVTQVTLILDFGQDHDLGVPGSQLEDSLPFPLLMPSKKNKTLKQTHQCSADRRVSYSSWLPRVKPNSRPVEAPAAQVP